MTQDAFGLPPLKADLRGSAAKLRAKQGPDKPKGPPEENGQRIATIARGDDEELRLSWAEYNGRHFLNIRIWRKADDGAAWFPDKTKGLTVRIRELPDFAEGIAKAVDLAASEAAAHG